MADADLLDDSDDELLMDAMDQYEGSVNTVTRSSTKRPIETAGLIPTALGGATGDYRDNKEYLPTGFGEIGQYLRNKRKKLQVQNGALKEDGKQYPQIFKGLAIYINGYTESIGLGELTELLVRHGGIYVPYLDQKALVTHILATNLTPTKRKEFASYKVAIPDWLVASVKEGKLLDWRLFSLLAPSKQDSPRKTGLEEEKDRMGTQTGQKSLFSMMGKSQAKGKGKGKEAQHPRPVTPPITSTSASLKPVNETRESLSERGARLAKSAMDLERQAAIGAAQAFFQPRKAPPTPVRPATPPTPTKQNPSTTSTESTDPPPPHETKSSKPPISSNLPATTDSPHPPNGVTSSWLPQRKRDDRTTALINDPAWLAQHTSASPDFLQAYFAQSRLHHLSSFKEDLKILVASRQAGKVISRKKKLTGTAADGRTIFHVDFDCFFVSAGLTSRGELRGKPIAVCHARGAGDSLSSTSEIASCSYEARDFGVKNGMSLGRARELCPDIQTMPFEFELYRELSLKFYEILLTHAHILQAVSMDEVLLEVKVPPTISRDSDPALILANKIRAEIFEATGCHASIGISHNITLARLATRKAKPANAYHLLPEEVPAFLEPLSVDSLPGIGWSLRRKLLEELKISTVGSLLRIRQSELIKVIGPGNASKFSAYANGIDDRELEVGKPRKSVSAEVNYGIRFEEGRNDQVERFMRELGQEVARRLRQESLKARQITLKVMTRHPDAPIDAPKLLGHGYVVTENKQSDLKGVGGTAIDDGGMIAETAWKLMKSLNAPPHELRGIGLQLHKLEKDGQSVDIVREKGQSKLSFAAPRPTSPIPVATKAAPTLPPAVDETPAPPSAQLSARPAPRPVEPLPIKPLPIKPLPTKSLPSKPLPVAAAKREVLILDDSDSDSTEPSKPIKGNSRTRSGSRQASLNKPAPYIPSLFKVAKKAGPAPPTASQITDEELEHYEISPDYYRALDSQSMKEVLDHAKRRKPVYAPKKKKQKTAAAPPPVVLNQKPIPSLAIIPASPADGLDDAAKEHLRAILPALDLASQAKFIQNFRNIQALKVQGTTSNRDSASTRNVGPVKDVSIRREPRFNSKTDVDEIRERLENWVVNEAGNLNEEDIECFAKYLEKCVSRENGHSLSQAVELIKWWSYLLEEEFGSKEAGKVGGNGQAWWEGYERTVDRIRYLVGKDTSCHLVL